ncbi:MAG: thiamine phosphate synthase [Proteobacteria bacterium]|nr:thiamine phosphate synthase [Pseudomonadota bacterium]
MSAAATDAPPRAGKPRVGGLYGVTPDGLEPDALVAQAAAAVRGGARVIQYRDKSATASARRARAAALAAALRGRALLIVNDDAALAAAVRADGVHLGADDGAVAPARALLGPDAIIGVSCYDAFARAERAVADGADYVAFGSFFASRVKPHAPVASLELLARGRTLGVPVVAIGGIDPGNAGRLRAAGADGFAVITALFGRGDPEAITEAARTLLTAWGEQAR